MSEPLIHSMNEFSSVILRCLEAACSRHVTEIGAEHGGMSTVLADWVAARGGELVSIDPAPSQSFIDGIRGLAHVRHVALPSLEALPTVEAADAWLVDGDHNWFTVFNELRLILAKSGQAGKPPLVFLHDVGWPWARRDLYYAPDRIPAEYLHPHSSDDGVTLDLPGLLPGGGFRGCGFFAAATHEGGARNGVLTAIEDVIAEQEAAGRRLSFVLIPAVFGLGVVFDADAPWSQAIASILRPLHQHPELGALERGRLADYLGLIAAQDKNLTDEPDWFAELTRLGGIVAERNRDLRSELNRLSELGLRSRQAVDPAPAL